MKVISIEKVIPRHTAYSILTKLPLFAGISEKHFDVLFEICSLYKVPPGTVLFEQGSSAQSLYIVLNGVVQISLQEKGVINLMRQGQVFGELGVINEMPRAARAQTLEESVGLLEIKKSDLGFLIGSEPLLSYTIMRNLAAEIAERYVQANKEYFSVRSHYMPQVRNVAVARGQTSEPIVIGYDRGKFPDVTHFRLSHISKGKLFHADGRGVLQNGDLVSVEEAAAGLRFQARETVEKAWFDVSLCTADQHDRRDTDKARVYVFVYPQAAP